MASKQKRCISADIFFWLLGFNRQAPTNYQCWNNNTNWKKREEIQI